jgi:hypothetical protein
MCVPGFRPSLVARYTTPRLPDHVRLKFAHMEQRPALQPTLQVPLRRHEQTGMPVPFTEGSLCLNNLKLVQTARWAVSPNSKPRTELPATRQFRRKRSRLPCGSQTKVAALLFCFVHHTPVAHLVGRRTEPRCRHHASIASKMRATVRRIWAKIGAIYPKDPKPTCYTLYCTRSSASSARGKSPSARASARR